MQDKKMPDCRDNANGSTDKEFEVVNNYTTLQSFTLSVATGITQQPSNQLYPTQAVIHNLQELKELISVRVQHTEKQKKCRVQVGGHQ